MALTIGIDLGGTKVAGGVVNTRGVIKTELRRPTPTRDADAVVGVIAGLIKDLADDLKISAVGVGAAGFVDERRAKVLVAPNLGWVNEPLRLAVERRVGLPVVVENDANAAAWGEFRFGGGRGSQHLVMLTIGTGIGSGIVLDGKLYRGAHGIAGEAGHICVEPEGRLCGCGARGCWEQYASGNALVRVARELAGERRDEAKALLDIGDGTPEGVQGKHVTQAAGAGDPVALAAFAYVGKWLGRGIATLVDVLDPDRIVLGGGVSAAGELVLQPTRTSFQDCVSAKADRPMPELHMAQLGNDAGLVGAADLARRH